ncbi:MAG: TraK family protein [Dehalococcoidia bacterium]|nr:TraK family protein [Dehalococcoidia bacterium]
MSRRYTEELGEWIKQKPARKGYKNLAAFLAVKSSVQEALSDGYAAKTIWQHMVETRRIEFGYDTFLKHTNQLIRKPQTCRVNETPYPLLKHPLAIQRPSNREAGKTAAQSHHAKGFVFDPEPNKEELF